MIVRLGGNARESRLTGNLAKAFTISAFEVVRTEVVLGPLIGGIEGEGLPIPGPGGLRDPKAEPVVVVDAQQLAAIGVGDIRIRTEDEVVLVVAL